MTFKKIIFSFLAVFVLFACSSDDNNSNNNGNGNGNGNGNNNEVFITFKANGVTYNMEPYTTSSLKVNVRSEEGIDDTFRAISLWMPLQFTTGSHSIVDSVQEDIYSASFGYGENNIDGTSGTIVITSITDDYIEGTFNFTGEDIDGNVYTITDGSFRSYNLQD